jgi:hypothetical protein
MLTKGFHLFVEVRIVTEPTMKRLIARIDYHHQRRDVYLGTSASQLRVGDLDKIAARRKRQGNGKQQNTASAQTQKGTGN